MKKQKGHIVLTVKDLSSSKKWYDDVLSFFDTTIAFADERNVYYDIPRLDMYLAFFQGYEEFYKDTFDRYRVGFHHLAIPAQSKEEVDEFAKHLKKYHVNINEGPQHFPDYGDELYYAVFFHDPDGLRLEVFFQKN